jgi:hypothetical protein
VKWGKCQPRALKIDGQKYDKDLILDRGSLRKRKKKLSREFRDRFGHTPLSLKEEIPWECKRLVIGTGIYGRLPVMKGVLAEAKRRGVEVIVCTTPEAVKMLTGNPADTNAILHVAG